jgi:hypothetical protein
MTSHALSVQQWRAVQRQLAARGGTLTIAKPARFSHPRDAGAHLTATWPVGQIADYVLALEAGAAPLLIREFTDRFEVFTDALQLTSRIVSMVEANPALAGYVGAALLGGVVGTAITGKREGALVGVGLGLLVAALLNARDQGDAGSR